MSLSSPHSRAISFLFMKQTGRFPADNEQSLRVRNSPQFNQQLIPLIKLILDKHSPETILGITPASDENGHYRRSSTRSQLSSYYVRIENTDSKRDRNFSFNRQFDRPYSGMELGQAAGSRPFRSPGMSGRFERRSGRGENKSR